MREHALLLEGVFGVTASRQLPPGPRPMCVDSEAAEDLAACLRGNVG